MEGWREGITVRFGNELTPLSASTRIICFFLMGTSLNNWDRILLLSPAELKNISKPQASFNNQTPSILPASLELSISVPQAQLVPHFTGRSILSLPIHFVFPVNLPLPNSIQTTGCQEKYPSIRKLSALSQNIFSVTFPTVFNSSIMWWSRSFLGRQEAKYQKCNCWGSYTGNQSRDFSSLRRLRVRSTQWSNTLAPTPAIAMSKSMVLEGFWVMFYKVYRSLVFKILSFRKTTPNLINMKMIPLEKQLSNNSSQATASPRHRAAQHTQTLL